MYYNMRIKTLRRNTTNALRRAQDGSTIKMDRANHILNTLTRSCKAVEREIEEAEFYSREEQNQVCKRFASVGTNWKTLFNRHPYPVLVHGLNERTCAALPLQAEHSAELRAKYELLSASVKRKTQETAGERSECMVLEPLDTKSSLLAANAVCAYLCVTTMLCRL
eukprot:7251715-Pyramimonas_sp.AAC.1